jgi:hypothetical protein
LLQQALIALIRERGYDAVTIQDIVDRANVGRTTFYLHHSPEPPQGMTMAYRHLAGAPRRGARLFMCLRCVLCDAVALRAPIFPHPPPC